MDDSAQLFPVHEDPEDVRVDLWLKTWFQLMLAEPVPPRLMDLVEHLDAGCGL